MKRTLFSVLIMLCTVSIWAQKPIKAQIKVEGEPELSRLYIQVGESGKYGKFKAEEVIEGKKGKFSYTTQADKIVPARLKRESGGNASYMTIILVPGEELRLTVKGEEYFYDGAKVYKDCRKADDTLTPIYKELIDYYNKITERLSGLSEEEYKKVLKVCQDTLAMKSEAFEKAAEEYARTNGDSEGAVLFLYNFMDVDTLYSLAGKEIQNGRVGEFLKSRIAYMNEQRELIEKQEREAQAKLDAMQGAPAKDFTLNDINGNPLSLSSLRGKYVILDFWGSWCGWCIKGIPDMKKYYEKYSDRLQILGVDCNDTEQKWKDAVEKYELPWLHVYNPRTSTVLDDYNITGFPTKIVIDPQGNVVKVIVGEDPAFYTYLDELFSK